MDLEPSFQQRQREAAGPNRELEHRSRASKLCQRVDSTLGVEACLRDPRVIDIDKIIAVDPRSKMAGVGRPLQALTHI